MAKKLRENIGAIIAVLGIVVATTLWMGALNSSVEALEVRLYDPEDGFVVRNKEDHNELKASIKTIADAQVEQGKALSRIERKLPD